MLTQLAYFREIPGHKAEKGTLVGLRIEKTHPRVQSPKQLVFPGQSNRTELHRKKTQDKCKESCSSIQQSTERQELVKKRGSQRAEV